LVTSWVVVVDEPSFEARVPGANPAAAGSWFKSPQVRGCATFTRGYHAAMTDHGPLGLRGDLARDAILRDCTSGLDERELFAQIATRLRPVVPYAAAGWLSTDPATLLYTDAVVEGVDSNVHLQFFENELVVPDFAKFADILRQPHPVAILAHATQLVEKREHIFCVCRPGSTSGIRGL
jgi:hypothetical protein